MQKTLKPTYFMKEMHEYDFKSFSKMIEFNLDLSKQDYDTFCPQNSIRLNHITLVFSVFLFYVSHSASTLAYNMI